MRDFRHRLGELEPEAGELVHAVHAWDDRDDLAGAFRRRGQFPEFLRNLSRDGSLVMGFDHRETGAHQLGQLCPVPVCGQPLGTVTVP
jgi:hypothetical protein